MPGLKELPLQIHLGLPLTHFAFDWQSASHTTDSFGHPGHVGLPVPQSGEQFDCALSPPVELDDEVLVADDDFSPPVVDLLGANDSVVSFDFASLQQFVGGFSPVNCKVTILPSSVVSDDDVCPFLRSASRRFAIAATSMLFLVISMSDTYDSKYLSSPDTDISIGFCPEVIVSTFKLFKLFVSASVPINLCFTLTPLAITPPLAAASLVAFTLASPKSIPIVLAFVL